MQNIVWGVVEFCGGGLVDVFFFCNCLLNNNLFCQSSLFVDLLVVINEREDEMNLKM